MQTTSEIVGREVELKALVAFLERAAEQPAALLIEGETGIGKTALWLEGLRAARERGYRVVRARPAEGESHLAYAALGDLAGELFDETAADLPAPQVRALGAALLRADVDEPVDPLTTATALLNVLKHSAGEQPLLVAVDDVQWLDPATKEALEFVGRRLPTRVALLLARRGEPGAAAPLGLDRAAPEVVLERLAPGPLSLAGIHHLLQRALGEAPSRPMVVRIAQASGGNPFFALELGRALSGGDGALAEPLPVPGSIDELTAHRVRALSAPAQEVALAVAALSHPTAAMVAAALPHVDVGEALREAEDRGAVVVDGERLQFSHPLLASAVLANAATSTRRDLHRRLAKVVSDPVERARHLAGGAAAPNTAVAAEVEQAAAHAQRRGASATAAELYEAALRLTPPEHRGEVARLALAQGAARFAAGDVDGARVLCERSVADAADGDTRARALLLLAQVAWVAGSQAAATAHVEQMLASCGDDSALRGKGHAAMASYAMRPEVVLAHAEAAASLLDEEHEPALLAQVLIQQFLAEFMLGHGARRELLDRGLALEAAVATAPVRSVIPLIWYRVVDDFDAARARYREDETWYLEHGQEGWRAQRLAHLAEVELRAGNWALAERHVEESCDLLEQVATGGPWSVALRFRAAVDAHLGRLERARDTLVAVIDDAERRQDMFWAGPALATLAFVELSTGDVAAADRALVRMAEHNDALGIEDHVGERSQPDHVEALVGLGELGRARDVLDRLERRGRAFPRLWIDATLPRSRALVLAGEGKIAEAQAELSAAPDRVVLPFEHARTLLVRGQVERRAKQKGAARQSLEEALALFERLGSPPWAERARAELERIGLRHRASDELTASERRIAELAASGLTNRQVAEAAFVSAKTVEANLARVYRKLGIRSRAELGARMAAGGGGPET